MTFEESIMPKITMMHIALNALRGTQRIESLTYPLLDTAARIFGTGMVYQHDWVGNDKREEVYDTDSEHCRQLRELLRTAAEETGLNTLLPNGKVTVHVSDSKDMPDYEPVIHLDCIRVSVVVYNDTDTVSFNTIMRPAEGVEVTTRELEWDRKPFPCPGDATTQRPVLLLEHHDLIAMTTTETSFNDFIKTAVDKGWQNIQRYGQQIVLIKH
ncbi:hypothetical protein FDI85_gp098 [Erwinia phage Machina]|uniref:Uncharacterized protein n=1 Tax=Erwinia phage Machina TaxID=1883375 RepID=A0A1B2IF33_9CAUD|nr:hypothetical protein FDI85_gp098 [Erwinia phage Machina]ANZ49824.1 hypothetical protein MACHINA_186 [Erwinia phage Machina]ANZ50096.1 hypothetical protein PARSHIK_187 [Erwinia phage vB_EamM_Parshik]